MRLFTYASETGPRVGAMSGRETFVALPFGSILELIRGGGAALAQARQALEALPALPLTGVRRLAPIPEPVRNIFCLGWNYAEHTREASTTRFKTEKELPTRPIFFTKATTTVLAPGAPIPAHPDTTSQLDWEGELGVILGKAGANIHRDRAMEHVFGYTVINDVSARDVQTAHGGQFFKGKSLDGTCPMGPWLVTRDEIEDPQDLQVTTRVNGLLKQNGHTSQMIFDIPQILEWLSQGMTLLPGDIIATGTPAGVGFARTPPEYLRSGDVVEVEVERIGLLRNPIL